MLKEWLLFEINKSNIDGLNCSLLPEIDYVISMLEEIVEPIRNLIDGVSRNEYEVYLLGINKLYQIRSLLIEKHKLIEDTRKKS